MELKKERTVNKSVYVFLKSTYYRVLFAAFLQKLTPEDLNH